MTTPELAEKGKDYFRYILSISESSHVLAKGILQKFNEAELKSMWMIAIEGVRSESISDFRYAVEYEHQLDRKRANCFEGNPEEGACDFIEKFVSESDTNCVILQNPLASPSDRCLRKCHSKLLFYEEQVYHLISHGQLPSEVELAMNEADRGAIWFVGACVENCGVELGETIFESDLLKMAGNSRHVFTSALDGAAYLFCTFD